MNNNKKLFMFIILNLGNLQQFTNSLKHELIHIKHHDFLYHLLQSITKIVFAFNPLVWWMDKQLSIAREIR